jgi:hypothetical protein
MSVPIKADSEQKVITQILALLQDPVRGFNVSVLQKAPLFSIPTDFIKLDFGTKSANFFLGQVDPTILEESGIINFPMACLYILEYQQTNSQKFSGISGIVRCVLDVYNSWTKITGLQNFDKYAHCVSSVVLGIINRQDNQVWTQPVTYNGNIQVKRGPVTLGGKNYVQQVSFSMIFEVNE